MREYFLSCPTHSHYIHLHPIPILCSTSVPVPIKKIPWNPRTHLATRPEFKAIVLSTQDFTVDFYFRQQWYDERLRFNDSQELCISNEMLGRIWWPDTFFTNAKLARFHDATTKNAFLRIQPSGLILQSLRYTRRPICLTSTAEKNTDRLIASTSQQGREIVR